MCSMLQPLPFTYLMSRAWRSCNSCSLVRRSIGHAALRVVDAVGAENLVCGSKFDAIQPKLCRVVFAAGAPCGRNARAVTRVAINALKLKMPLRFVEDRLEERQRHPLLHAITVDEDGNRLAKVFGEEKCPVGHFA